MRLTFTVTSAGRCYSIGGLPRVRVAECYPDRRDGRGEQFDEAAFRAAVKDCRSVQFAADDRGCVCAFAALLCASLGDWMEDMDRDDGTDADVTRAARSIKARAKRGVSARVRVDLTAATVETKPGRLFRTVRVRIRHDDLGVPSADRFDLDCALIVADFCLSYSRRFVERGGPPLVFAPETEALLIELRRRTEAGERRRKVKEANIARHRCERLTGGEYCSPCRFDCPHFHGGKCRDITEADLTDAAESVPCRSDA